MTHIVEWDSINLINLPTVGGAGVDNPGVWVGRENGVCAGVEYGLATLGEGLVPCRRPLIGGAPPLSFPLIPESSLKEILIMNK